MRPLILTAAAVAAASTVTALAASLTAAGPTLAAGTAAVAACDGAVTTAGTTSGGKLSSVTVSGIADPGCEGGQLRLTVMSSGAVVGSGGPVSVPTDGDTADNSVAVSISELPAPDGIDAARVVISGP